jgi:hypothetical protein
MQVSEQNKQEADKVVAKYAGNYSIKPRYYGQPNIQGYDIKPKHYECAIQDRQSVLEALIKVAYLPAITDHKLKKELDNINEQIEYLKTKL